MAALKVSMATFNEINDLLEREGRKIGDGKTIQLEKTDIPVPPYNFRLVTIRRDVADIAAKSFNSNSGKTFVEYVNELYEWVLEGKKKEVLTVNPAANPNTGWGKDNA